MTLQVFRYIFTSPLSAEFMVDNLNSKFFLGQPKRHCCRERCTRSNVASLLGMKTVAPRAIAYIAVQVSIFFRCYQTLPLITNLSALLCVSELWLMAHH